MAKLANRYTNPKCLKCAKNPNMDSNGKSRRLAGGKLGKQLGKIG